MRQGIMAMEAIAFQNGVFYKNLTDAVGQMHAIEAGLSDEAYFKSKEALAVLSTLKRHTGITFKLLNGDSTGPAMMPPALDINHVFMDAGLKDYAQATGDFDGYADVRKLTKGMGVKIINGEVNLQNSTVSGAFEKLEIDLYLPRSMFSKRGLFSNAEIAAVILHETGHAFTYMEFVSRTVTTNQVLAGLVRGLDGTVTPDKKKAIFAVGADLLRLNEEQQRALLTAKGPKEVACIVLDSAVQHSVSELGASVYDINSCEYLADQFATRHGAGRELVTALDKFNRNSGWTKRTASFYFIEAISTAMLIIGAIYLTVASAGLVWLLVLFVAISSADKEGEIYDNEKSRFRRIKHQNIERLKDKHIGAREKKALIESNETIDRVCTFYDDNLSLIQKAAYYLRPSYRNAHKYELLQKDIEMIGFSDLFTHAAKLSLI